jgi:hypothetical protein
MSADDSDNGSETGDLSIDASVPNTVLNSIEGQVQNLTAIVVSLIADRKTFTCQLPAQHIPHCCHLDLHTTNALAGFPKCPEVGTEAALISNNIHSSTVGAHSRLINVAEGPANTGSHSTALCQLLKRTLVAGPAI